MRPRLVLRRFGFASSHAFIFRSSCLTSMAPKRAVHFSACTSEIPKSLPSFKGNEIAIGVQSPDGCAQLAVSGVARSGAGGVVWCGVVWWALRFSTGRMRSACDSHAAGMRSASVPAAGCTSVACRRRPQRAFAASLAAWIRWLRVAANGLCSIQSWMKNRPGSPSRNPTSISACTRTPGAPPQSAAIAISSSLIPERLPSGRLSATQRKRHTSAQQPRSSSRRRSLTVFGCRGKVVEIRASSAISPGTSHPAHRRRASVELVENPRASALVPLSLLEWTQGETTSSVGHRSHACDWQFGIPPSAARKCGHCTGRRIPRSSGAGPIHRAH